MAHAPRGAAARNHEGAQLPEAPRVRLKFGSGACEFGGGAYEASGDGSSLNGAHRFGGRAICCAVVGEARRIAAARSGAIVARASVARIRGARSSAVMSDSLRTGELRIAAWSQHRTAAPSSV